MTTAQPIDTVALAALEAELARQLKLVDAIGAEWTRPRSHPEGMSMTW
jgi:hypothetical protein